MLIDCTHCQARVNAEVLKARNTVSRTIGRIHIR
jgi:hypothetical protein